MEKSLPCQTGFGQVRMAVPSDADAIVDMAHRLAAHHGDAATLSRGDLLRDAFADPPWIYLILAEAEGMAVGYAVLCRLIRLQFGTRGFDLHHLFTEPAFRGRGVGTGLVDACGLKAKAMACDYLTVSTHPDNLAAQRFYESRGFVRRVGEAPRFAMRLDA